MLVDCVLRMTLHRANLLQLKIPMNRWFIGIGPGAVQGGSKATKPAVTAIWKRPPNIYRSLRVHSAWVWVVSNLVVRQAASLRALKRHLNTAKPTGAHKLGH
jgi:hypothetical protein